MVEVDRRPSEKIRKTVRVVLVNEANEVLLLQKSPKSNASNLWEVPGGGIEKRDKSLFRRRTLKNAAIREVKEETGATLKRRDLQIIGGFNYRYQGKKDTIMQERCVEVLFIRVKGNLNVSITEDGGNKHVGKRWVPRGTFAAMGRSIELSGNTKPIPTMLDFANV